MTKDATQLTGLVNISSNSNLQLQLSAVAVAVAIAAWENLGMGGIICN